MHEADREAILKLIRSHERHIKFLQQAGFADSAEILRISWLDLMRHAHEITVPELEAFTDALRGLLLAGHDTTGQNGTILAQKVVSRRMRSPLRRTGRR